MARDQNRRARTRTANLLRVKQALCQIELRAYCVARYSLVKDRSGMAGAGLEPARSRSSGGRSTSIELPSRDNAHWRRLTSRFGLSVVF